MSSGETVGEDSLQGVRGWLLVLCLFLMVGMPLVALLGILSAWQSAQASPLMRTTLVAVVVIELGLALFALHAGFALYSMRRNAVRVAKAYLITMLGVGAFGLISNLLGALSPSQSGDAATLQRLSGPAAIASLLYMAFFGLCLLYLLRSRRVRATYPHN